MQQLFHLAWPASLTLAVRSLYRVNDQFFVQDLGVVAQSAVAVGSMIAIWLFAFGELVGVGNLAIAARRLGAGETERAHRAMRTSLRLGAGIGTLLALVTVFSRHWLSGVLIPGAEDELERALLAEYLLWIGIGQILLVTMPALESSFMAMRRSRVPMGLEFLAVASNVVLNAILVPRYGVAGAGIATCLSRVVPLLIGVALLGAAVPAPLTGEARWQVASKVLRIGLPTCIAIAMYSAVYQVMLAWTFPHFGAAGRSALGAGFGIESVFFCAYWGVAYAVGTLVGRSLGAGDPDHAAAIARVGFWVNLAFGVVSSISFWVLGPTMVGVLCSDAVAVESNVTYLAYMAYAQPFQSVCLVYEQVLAGAGLTAPIMWSTGVMNVLRIPAAHLLGVTLGFGLVGVWWAINASSIGKCIWAWLLFRAGRWRVHQV